MTEPPPFALRACAPTKLGTSPPRLLGRAVGSPKVPPRVGVVVLPVEVAVGLPRVARRELSKRLVEPKRRAMNSRVDMPDERVETDDGVKMPPVVCATLRVGVDEVVRPLRRYVRDP
ncbi:MAG: hypothetical protein AAGD14_04995 [Planctomycetota bacterium]